MNTRLLMKASLIAAIAAVSIAPVASQASSKKGLDNCIDTFVKEQVPQGHPVRIVKRARFEYSLLGFSGPETYEVHAKGAESGESYGSAKCVVGRKGEVLAMYVEGSPIRLAKDITPAEQASGG